MISHAVSHGWLDCFAEQSLSDRLDRRLMATRHYMGVGGQCEADPGLTVGHASDLGIGDHVWALQNNGDWFENAGGRFLYGEDPTRLSFGARVIEATNTTETGLFSSHALSVYMQNRDLALIATGQGRNVEYTQYGLVFYPFPEVASSPSARPK